MIKFLQQKFRKFKFKALDAYINPVSNELAPNGIDYNTLYRDIMKKIIGDDNLGQKKAKYYKGILKSDKFAFTKRDIKKYMSDEYKGTDIQYRAFEEYFMLDEEYEPLGYEMLNDNADEIFDDVDRLVVQDDTLRPKFVHGMQFKDCILLSI